MNGADALIGTLLANSVEVCFANPGTSELQFVAALDRYPTMRAVLGLFEGVATGAADGYGRMTGRPACTLLHLGPGYANGAANLHNARRAFTPIVNVVGDHATYHRRFDAPLASDIESLARPNSLWVKSADSPDAVAALTAEAIAASRGPPGGPVSLILPADSAWLETAAEPVAAPRPVRAKPAGEMVEAAARAIRGAAQPSLLVGGQACGAEGLAQASRLAAVGVRVLADTFPGRQARGAGVFAPARLPYFGEMALAELAGVDLMVLAGTSAPVAFFAYPDRPSSLVPEGCATLTLADRAQDAVAGLAALADALGAPAEGPVQALARPDAPAGPLTPMAAAACIARHLPEGAVICDDSVSAGFVLSTATAGAAAHELLAVTGGAIGASIPLAVGASVAAPDRKVLALSGDGAAMYTVQGLWTLARERLDVTVVVFANAAYRILDVELARTGAGARGPAAARLLGLGDPRIGWTALAQGMGVAAVRCETAEAFDAAFAAAMRERGPMLIEAVVP